MIEENERVNREKQQELFQAAEKAVSECSSSSIEDVYEQVEEEAQKLAHLDYSQ